VQRRINEYKVVSPGIISRFEVFYDETMPGMKVGHHIKLYFDI
jgi:hypothetical protein